MSSRNAKQWMLAVASAGILLASSFAAHAATNINLAVASNFFGIPPSNSAITDLINAFEMANPNYTVTVVDNGATATLASHIISGNSLKVDLFLAADTATPLDLLTNHFGLVTTYNNSFTPPLYIFNYAQGILALLSNTPNVDLSCETGTCGYDPGIFSTVAIADPSLAPRPRISQHHGNFQCGYRPDGPGRICGNVRNLLERKFSDARQRNECFSLFHY